MGDSRTGVNKSGAPEVVVVGRRMWAAALAGQPGKTGDSIAWRSFQDEHLPKHAFIVLDLDAAPWTEVVNFFRRLRCRSERDARDSSVWVAVGAEALRRQWELRAIGVQAVFRHPWQRAAIWRMVNRYRSGDGAPRS